MLNNQPNTLFITGGSGEIGRSIVQLFKKNSYEVISPSSAELDCSNPLTIDDYFSKTKLPLIKSVVHCAGWNEPKPFAQITDSEMIKSIYINSFSFLKIVKNLLPNFIDGETRVSAISSLYGFLTRKNRLAYTSSKHSLNGIVKELSLELGELGILCNSISPGFIDTKMTRKNNSVKVINDLISRIPISRLGTADDIAKIVYFITTTQNPYINGQNIIVDGGYSIGGFQN
jgi:NAD(P)-dependent dehydrogenase (short-subunit alcohol dehydrogenase family)